MDPLDADAATERPAPPPAGGPALAAVLHTPFVASWFHRARPGDVADFDPTRRAAAWAHWALDSLVPMTGSAGRTYVAVSLPGRFYDRRGTGTLTPPHLELPDYILERAASEFPDRLAQVGNALRFPTWLVPETLAARRALFSVPRTPPLELLDVLNDRRVSLRDALVTTTAAAAEVWPTVEELLVADPRTVSEHAVRDIETAELASYWPVAADLGLRVEFDRRLKDREGPRAARRVGVWRIVGTGDDGPYALGVVIPRLTRSSVFTDPLFDPAGESPAACLVRGLVLRRLLAQVGGRTAPPVGREPLRLGGGTGLRAVPAHVGEKLPEAGVAAAVKFVTAYPDPHDAWTVLTTWANTRGTASEPARAALTVTEEAFVAAHHAAARAIRVAESPRRADIDTILPLAWDASSQVVRVTFAPR